METAYIFDIKNHEIIFKKEFEAKEDENDKQDFN